MDEAKAAVMAVPGVVKAEAVASKPRWVPVTVVARAVVMAAPGVVKAEAVASR